ncbi:MAG: ABC transporter permease [Chloroflexi bacterium]|nr:ABC transporter permease [Chloroflexota bacterium]
MITPGVDLGPRLLTGLARSVLVLWVALTLVFLALRVLPGDAVSGTLIEASATDIRARREQLGLDDPYAEQYLRYLSNLLQGDLGYSLITSERVSDMIGARLLPTLSLGLASFGVAIALGLLLGLGNGLNGPVWLSAATGFFITISQAIPFYVTALLAIHLISVQLDWLPASGSQTPSHLILPALTLGFHTAGAIARVLSANLQDTYRQPYILAARAKGLAPIDLLDHALRIAILPTLGVVAIQAGFILGGSVILEVLFVRRGLGTLLYQSVLNRDYPVVQALTLLGALLYLLANGTSSVARYTLDPRLREVRTA